MTDHPHDLTGGCHCGNLQYRLHTRREPGALPLRRCGCSFCRRIGARYSSDPQGELQIEVRDEAALSRYRFSSRVVEFLVCRHCGGMPAAVTRIDGRNYGVINVNTLDQPLDGEAVAIDHSAETPEQGRQRRQRNWTPAHLNVAPPAEGAADSAA